MDSPYRSHSSHSRFDLSAELIALDATSPSSYDIGSGEVDLASLSTAEQSSALNTLIDQLALTRPEEIHRQDELWDGLRSFLKHFDALDDAARSKVADGITSSFASLIQSIDRDVKTASSGRLPTNTLLDDSDDEDAGVSPEELRRTYCEPLEMWAFLVNWLIYIADKVANTTATGATKSSAAAAKPKGRGKKAAAPSSSTAAPSYFAWTEMLLPQLLNHMANFLQGFSSTLFYPLATPRDALLATFLRPALHLFERESNLKVGTADLKSLVFLITCLSVKRHGQSQTAQTMLLQMLQYYEHVPEVVAQLLTMLRTEYDSPRLAEEVLAEIAGREFGGGNKDGAGFAMSANLENKIPRVFARFLVAFTEANPRSTLKNISLLQNLIESEAYPIRNAMVEIFYLLIRDLVTSNDELPTTGVVDEDTRETPEEARRLQIESFWAVLFSRFLDVNSYVRVKVLSTCCRLCDLPAKFPAQRTKLLTLAQRALKDKSSSARKASVTLLIRLILTHPYGVMHGGELDEAIWSKRVEEVKLKMQEIAGAIELPAELEEIEEEDEEVNEDESMDNTVETAKPRKSTGRKSPNTAALSSQLSQQDLETLERLKLTHRYYADALQFIKTLSSSMPVLEDLLFSTNKAEALESMDFFRIAAEYKLPRAESGMRRMVHLVWTKDNAMVEPTANPEDREANPSASSAAPRSIKGRLMEVYTSHYLTPLDHLSEKENAGLIARNLVGLTKGTTLAELTSLEELLATISADGLIPSSVIERLWSVYASQDKRAERSTRRGAIIVLSMLAASRKEIVKDKIDTLLGIGLGPLGSRDLVLARWSVVALGRIGGSTKKVKGALSDKRIRFSMAHPMFSKMRAAILAGGLVEEADKRGEEKRGEWFTLAEECIKVIYQLGEQPDGLCSEIVKWFMGEVFGRREGEYDDHQASQASEGGSQQPIASTSHPTLATRASAFQLAQLLFTVGHVALKQIVYLETVEREYKRRKAEAEKSAGDTKGKTGRKAGKDKASSTATASKADKDKEEEGDELEQVAGNVEDDIGDVVAEIREKELLFGGRSLLALFGPMVVHISSNPKSYSSEHLRKAAVLTLCKFMCVSSSFCEGNLSLLLHILATSSDAVIRSNVVIALGDIAVSFGSLIDENSERLYAGLSDKDLGVKKHTLMVLTHLILNGMIKVKGQLGEMAKCLEDPEPRVSDLARLFFSELAGKENAVYNNLPDIISHLSRGKHAVDEETFERTMRFIFKFVDKEKQAENVVDKLCQRFKGAVVGGEETQQPINTPKSTSAAKGLQHDRQWRDIAFCLSLLPYKSERSLKKLIEALPFYQDKLGDPEVYKRFVEIIGKARSARGTAAAKAGGGGLTETELQDFEQTIENYHVKGSEEMELVKGTQAKVAKAKANVARGAKTTTGSKRGGGATRGRGRGAAANRRSADLTSEEEETGEESTVEAAPPASSGGRRGGKIAAARPARGGGSRRKAVVEDSDDDSF